MPDRTDAIVALLKSIDGSLKKMAATNGTEIAPAHDLDSTYGDPELRFSPRDWSGDNYKGRKFSECPPALLDEVARSLDYFALKAEEKGETTSTGKPVAPLKKKDAARARGWAKRLREGWKPATFEDPLLDSPEPDLDPFSLAPDDDIPF
jgi:hypothetical protein